MEPNDAFKLPPNQFSPDKSRKSRERGEASCFNENFCCYFLEEASVGVSRCLWGGLVALCTMSPSLPHTGIWWQTRFNLPAMSSWVQLLIAGCGGVTCPVRNEFKWMVMIQSREGMDSGSSQRFRSQMAGEKWFIIRKKMASEVWNKTDQYLIIILV